MSPEFYTIIGVAIGLAGLILNGQFSGHRALADLRREVGELRSEIAHLRSEMYRELAALREEMHREFAAVRTELSALTERVARLEGLVTGPRETAVGEGA